MAENEGSNDSKSRGKTLGELVTLWVGILGSLVTIALTIWNTRIQAEIGKREESLKALELQLKERTTGIEESKERVDRYKWVLSLFPDLNQRDDKKKNFTISLIQLALTEEEAEKLFTSLQTSSDKALQSLGQSGINALQIEPIVKLTSKINASTAEVRKSAVAELVRDYNSSTQAIELVLRMYDPDKIGNLSSSGLINGFYYLSATDPSIWDREHIATAGQVISRVEARELGPERKAALEKFKSFFQSIPIDNRQ